MSVTQVTVTVYITSFNYARFLPEAVESVLRQSLSTWELYIVDDGSIDATAAVASGFAARDDRIRFLRHEDNRGLRVCANEVLRLSKGQYIIRLDADDLLDESALLVLSNYLDKHREVGLVYPNWVYIDAAGRVLGVERRKRIGVEANVLDMPAHGACTMIRKRVLKAIGGYDPDHSAQDGHEIWLKVLDRYGVGHVETPLFSYRQHSDSMSQDQDRILNARQKVKASLVAKHAGEVSPVIAGIIPAKNSYVDRPNVVLEEVLGRPLIDYTIEAAIEARVFNEILVFTDDDRVVEYCEKFSEVRAVHRSPSLSSSRTTLSEVVWSAVQCLEGQHNIYSDIVVSLSVHSPLRQAKHIREAIDTLILYNVDSVVSACEDIELHFVHGRNGMEPLNPGALKQLRFEREAIFVDNGAVHAIWRDAMQSDALFGERLGHIVMPPYTRQQYRDVEDKALIELWLNRRASGDLS